MSDVSAKEFGKLQAGVEYLKDTSDRHTALLEKMDVKMDVKMDGLVTHEQLEERLEPIHTTQKDIVSRVANLEKTRQLSEASIWRKIGVAVESNFIKFVASGVLIFVLATGYLMIKQDLTKNDVQIIETVKE